jgi:hypothetical protein
MAQQKSSNNGITFHLFAVNLLEKLVGFFKGLMTSKLLAFCIKWLSLIGHIGLIVAAAIGFIFSLIFAIRANDFAAFGTGLIWVVLVFVIQYTAHKFSSAGEDLIKNNPTQLASQTFLDCFGFLVLIGGVVVFVMSLIDLIKGYGLISFLIGFGIFIFLEFVAMVAFNPQDIAVKMVQDNSAGQEAIGVITFFIKTLMKLVPILFGAAIAIGTVMLFIEGTRLFGDGAGFAWVRMNDFIAPNIIYAALLPFLSYLFFVLCYLSIDIIRAILSIPGKLDK